MNISHFDHLLAAARQLPDAQRLLLVFAAASMPAGATAEQRARFEAGESGELAPLMCVDKDPAELEDFATLQTEALSMGQDRALVFAAALSGQGSQPPASKQVVAALTQMVEAVKPGEFGKAVEGSQLARGRILDWFHVAMKFKAAENSVFGSTTIEPLGRAEVKTGIDHAKWLVWHGKGGKSVARIKALDASLLARQGYEYSTLWWNLRRLYFYIDNADTLVNYGARYRKGLPISSSIAESAVNLVVSHRMAKKQQMRWTDEGAHCLAQVRVADLNGELSVQRLAALAKMPGANSPHARQAA